MNPHDLVNAILVVVGVGIFVARIVSKLSKSVAGRITPLDPKAPQPATAPVAHQQLLPAAPAVIPAVRKTGAARPPRPKPAAVRSPAVQGFAPEAAAAFPVLDLTLPDAETPGLPGAAPKRKRPPGAGLMPGSRGWGAQAIVAMEILGPPVSLRSGATLGAPHAF